MLRSDTEPKTTLVALSLIAGVGVAAAWLVDAGNPGNMGICGACFLRDTAGSMGMIAGPGPRIFRPEIVAIPAGAFLWSYRRLQFSARSGSFAISRFLLGVATAFGALVFLGCPFRMLQRIGGGDLNAWIGATGFIAGVGVAHGFERRGYTIGKTSPAPAPVGLSGIFIFVTLFALFVAGGKLFGPGPFDDTATPPHAPLYWTLGVGAAAGIALAATGFCAVSAARGVFTKQKKMLVGGLLLTAGYGVTSAIFGKFKFSFDGQPVAHGDALWNILALAWVGLCGALCGGCPVRQLVMAGEGNGDAFITVLGIFLGGALAHQFGIVSTATGPTTAGMWTVAAGLLLTLSYAAAVTQTTRRGAAA